MTQDSTFEASDSQFQSHVYRSSNVIKPYAEDNKLRYPHIMLEAESLEMFRIKALSGMTHQLKYIEDNIADGELFVYLSLHGQVLGLGLIPQKSLRELLGNPTFGVFYKYIMMDTATRVEGELMYALCATAS